MQKHYHRLVQTESKVKVAIQAQPTQILKPMLWQTAFVAVMLGIFYFFSPFFKDSLWQALMGG